MKKTTKSNEKFHICNYREKSLLIANYFYGKSRKELNIAQVYDMWRNWFNEDFMVGDKPVFKLAGDKVVLRKKPESKAEERLFKKYTHLLYDSYAWIKKSVENKHNSMKYFQNEIDKIHRREFAILVYLAKPKGIYVTLSNKNLYKNHLGYYSLMQDGKTLTSGKFIKMQQYLNSINKKGSKIK